MPLECRNGSTKSPPAAGRATLDQPLEAAPNDEMVVAVAARLECRWIVP
jgi:hypothetical protein